MKILLADDDPFIHHIVTLWLNRNGHEVSNVHNGLEALAKLKKDSFDVLITDVNMPLMKGIDLVKEVLQLPQRPDLIVVLTSRCDTGQLKKDLNNPQVHLFNKPFSPAVLTELIERLHKENQHPHEQEQRKTVANAT